MKNPIQIKIPPGVKIITVGFGESIVESDDAVRAGFEQAETQGVASVNMAKEEEATKATGLDILRMRGTPIDMIYSAIVVEDFDGAIAMFRTSVLEYVYEKIAAVGWGVSFLNSRGLHRKDEVLGHTVNGDSGKTIALTPEHDTLPFTGRGLAKVCNVDSGKRSVYPINDAGIAVVIHIIEEISDTIFSEVSQGISNAKLTDGAVPTIAIIVDLGTFSIGPKDNGLEAEVSIPMVAWCGDVN